MRKEIFVSVGLMGHALLISHVREGDLSEIRYKKLWMVCVMPYLLGVTFIHEIQLFFLPAHAVLLTIALPQNRLRPIHLLADLVVMIGMMILMITYSGNDLVVRSICNSWTAPEFDEKEF